MEMYGEAHDPAPGDPDGEEPGRYGWLGPAVLTVLVIALVLMTLFPVK